MTRGRIVLLLLLLLTMRPVVAQSIVTGVVETLSYGNESGGWSYVTLLGGANLCPASGAETNKGWYSTSDIFYKDFRGDALLSKFLNMPVTYTVANEGYWCRVVSWKWTLN